jgi:ribosomal protein S18 acetylase RimI-like enzyme
MQITPARACDLPEVAALVNGAYRGEGAAAGWTTEAGYITGQRTDVALLRADLAAQPDAQLLIWRDEADGPVLGCVWLAPLGQGRFYLGMLAIRPDLQDRQLGRSLLRAAERRAADLGAEQIEMTVINIRDSLIAWYQRRGYRLTGETRPFPHDQAVFGTALRSDLTFVVLEKSLAGAAAG